jgi:hypothetical protein
MNNPTEPNRATGTMARLQRLFALDRSQMFRMHLLKTNLRARYDLLRASAPSTPSDTAAHAYIMGCGRSGTTILGSLLESHSEVDYLFEPTGRWAMIDHRTDIWKQYSLRKGGDLLTRLDVTPKAQKRFAKLLSSSHPLLIDKSPEHTLRIGYLLQLDPTSKFVHIVRDPFSVATSISEMASHSFPIYGEHRYNSWWGLDDAKWLALNRVTRKRGYLEQETAGASPAIRGICEWLISVNEVNVHRDCLGEQLLEITYEELVSHPHTSIERVATFLALPMDERWVHRCASLVKQTSNKNVQYPALSEELARELRRYQSKYGFPPLS